MLFDVAALAKFTEALAQIVDDDVIAVSAEGDGVTIIVPDALTHPPESGIV